MIFLFDGVLDLISLANVKCVSGPPGGKHTPFNISLLSYLAEVMLFLRTFASSTKLTPSV